MINAKTNQFIRGWPTDEWLHLNEIQLFQSLSPSQNRWLIGFSNYWAPTICNSRRIGQIMSFDVEPLAGGDEIHLLESD